MSLRDLAENLFNSNPGPSSSASTFYFRDWHNADRFKPNITPPRQKFAGFVEFDFNPLVFGDDSSIFRTQIGSLIQTAKIPEISFNTITKKQYNHRRVIQTGVDYGPCTISVVDTVSNDWLMVFMKYFSYHYNDPRNSTGPGNGEERDTNPAQWDSNSQVTSAPSKFLSTGYKSNDAGLDIKKEAHFINQIRIVNYHGGSGVEYILFRPTITSFSGSELDYSDLAGFRTFDISFEIEHMTVNQKFNFKLNDIDLARFDQSDLQFPMFDDSDATNKTMVVKERNNKDFLGTPDEPIPRAGQ